MPRTYRSIVIVLLFMLLGTTSPCALGRTPEAVEELASIARRIVQYLSDAKTVTDAARAVDTIISDHAAQECRNTSIPGMNDPQCAHEVTRLVEESLDAAKRKCPHLSAQERMTSDIDCFGIMERLEQDLKVGPPY